MIIYPTRRESADGGEEWTKPVPFILEERDLNIVRDYKDPNGHDEPLSAQEIRDVLMEYLGKRITAGCVMGSQSIFPMAEQETVYGKRGGTLRHIANNYISQLNAKLKLYRDEFFARRLGPGWGLDVDIVQGTVTPYIIDEELALRNSDEIQKQAMKLARQLIKSGAIR